MRNIAPSVDMFLVVTSDYSSNGMRLLELAQDLTGSAKRIESVADLQPEWFSGVRSVGITSAASTPDDLVQELVSYFQVQNSALNVVEHGEVGKYHFPQTEAYPGGGRVAAALASIDFLVYSLRFLMFGIGVISTRSQNTQ